MAELKDKKDTVRDEKRSGITVYPDDDLRKRLERYCEEEDRSLSNSVGYILKEYFKSIDDEK